MKFCVWVVLLRYSVWTDEKRNVIVFFILKKSKRIRILPVPIVLVGVEMPFELKDKHCCL